MNEQERDALFDVQGNLVEIETCIEQIGIVCGELATPSAEASYESFLHFVSTTLGMYADRISNAEERLDNILHGSDEAGE